VLWEQMQTPHYRLFYHRGSLAQKHIASIARWQEKCYKQISALLGVQYESSIRMYLCDSPAEIAQITGCPPCNGMTFDYDLIYAVFNEQVQCLGPHEDAHILSYQMAIPESIFVKESLAMYFDGAYHGVQNERIAGEWIRSHSDFEVTSLKENRVFIGLPEPISYPLAGAYASWMIHHYGVSAYLKWYCNAGSEKIGIGKDSLIADRLFAEWLKQDEVCVEKRTLLDERDEWLKL